MANEFNLNCALSEAWYSACEADHHLSNALYIIRLNLNAPIDEGALHRLDEARSYIDQAILDICNIQKALQKGKNNE